MDCVESILALVKSRGILLVSFGVTQEVFHQSMHYPKYAVQSVDNSERVGHLWLFFIKSFSEFPLPAVSRTLDQELESVLADRDCIQDSAISHALRLSPAEA